MLDWTLNSFELDRSNSPEPRFVNQNWTSNPIEPLQKPELWTHLARSRPNPGLNMEKPNFEVRTIPNPISRTSNSRTGFNPTLPWYTQFPKGAHIKHTHTHYSYYSTILQFFYTLCPSICTMNCLIGNIFSIFFPIKDAICTLDNSK